MYVGINGSDHIQSHVYRPVVHHAYITLDNSSPQIVTFSHVVMRSYIKSMVCIQSFDRLVRQAGIVGLISLQSKSAPSQMTWTLIHDAKSHIMAPICQRISKKPVPEMLTC
jgi:hypothetical protein